MIKFSLQIYSILWPNSLVNSYRCPIPKIFMWIFENCRYSYLFECSVIFLIFLHTNSNGRVHIFILPIQLIVYQSLDSEKYLEKFHTHLLAEKLQPANFTLDWRLLAQWQTSWQTTRQTIVVVFFRIVFLLWSSVSKMRLKFIINK